MYVMGHHMGHTERENRNVPSRGTDEWKGSMRVYGERWEVRLQTIAQNDRGESPETDEGTRF